MLKSKKLIIPILIVSIIAFIIGLISLWYWIQYEWHHWNFYGLRDRYSWFDLFAEEYITMLIICLGGLLLFGVFFFIFRNKKNVACRIISYILFTLYCCATLFTIFAGVTGSKDIKEMLNNMRLDNQLESEDPNKFYESVDYIISHKGVYAGAHGEPNEYMMTAARNGYAPAQHSIGNFFYGQAVSINNDHYGYRRWNTNSSTQYCKEQIDRATYWWLKAAMQNDGASLLNLGLQSMGQLLSNKPNNFDFAHQCLTEAAKNGQISAYYYLGLLHKESSISDAVKYWQLGAKKGDKGCIRMLENPDFIGIEVSKDSQ